ncbi:protein of unknown function [Caballeronia sp. S22]
MPDVQQQAGRIEGLVQRVCEEGISAKDIARKARPAERSGALFFVRNSLDRDKNRLYTRQGKKSRACASLD